MLKFEDFLKTFSSLSVLEGSAHARYIYEQIICREDTVVEMILASEAGVPALSACAGEIEAYCAAAADCDVDLSDRTVRQSVGRMVKAALQPMGYQVCGRRSLAKELRLRHFKNASVYAREGVALRITLETEGGDCTGRASCVLP